MHNIRKKLTIFAVLMFAASVTLNIAASFSDRGATVASSESTVPEETIKDALFGGDAARFVAHRGYSAAAPENTTLAFELAGKSQFWGIETDISQTYDGEFVCMHDDEVDRMTDGTGLVGSYTYAALRELTIDDGSNIDFYQNLKIPSMTEYLNICITYGCVPVIEIKNITDYDKFLQTIYDSGVKDRCIVTGDIEDLSEIRARDADIMLMVIGFSENDYTYYTEIMSNIGGVNNGVLYNSPAVTQEAAADIRSQNLACGIWTLNSADEAAQYLEYGVDYIVTDAIPASLDLMINANE
ncbi:MAG: hypothetical protein LUD03_04015 [Firmicutes bacterium]|nr:hypothetical protein [Bacillota bacterium]